MQNYLESFDQLIRYIVDFLYQAPFLIILAVQVLIIIVIAYVINKFLVRYIKRASKRLDFPPEVTNGLIMIVRIVILLAVLTAISSVGGLPSEFFISISAIAGAAIGFAATRTVGNFIAGIYLLISRPFRIGDYIRIGNTEGIVKEMTINYTKIQVPDGTKVLMSNQTILDATIINFSVGESRYVYPLKVTFDFNFSKNEIEEIIAQVSSEFKTKGLIKDCNYSMVGLNRLEQQYLVNLIFENTEPMLSIPSKFLAKVAERADKLRKAKK
ncbi:MAG: mechanosensitive ion channel family protein [Candidatus Asgardarchaeia archaeon]